MGGVGGGGESEHVKFMWGISKNLQYHELGDIGLKIF